MKARSRRLLILAFIAFAAFCVLRAPVSLLTLFLPHDVQLKNVEGSLWNGRASAIGQGELIIQERVDWRFHPQTLLAGRLEWAISGRFGEKSSALTLVLRPNGAELSEVSLYLPLEPFIAQNPRLKAVRIGALLHATTHRVARNVPVSASIDVDGLFSPMVPLASQLGNYRFDLELDAAGKGTWRATTLAGILAVSGDGSLDTKAQQIAGKLVLTPSTTLPGLSPALSQLPRSGDGYLVSF